MDGVKQDMPPKGGFESIVYERVPLKKYWPGSVKLGIGCALMAFGWYQYSLYKKRLAFEATERTSARHAILPMLLAENDRIKLRQYRKNRDEEAELMKNVEGWQVGTWMGEPIYKTLDEDDWYYPHYVEYWAHADPNYMAYANQFTINC